MLAQRYLTVVEVARLLRVSKMTIYRLASEGTFKGAVQVGKEIRIPEGGVQEYLKGRLITSQGTGPQQSISELDESE